MFDSYIIFSSSVEKVITQIDLAVMASYDDSTFGRVDFMVNEEHTSEDPVDKLVKVHPLLIPLKNFQDLSKKNPPTKESEVPPRKESVLPPLNIIQEDACSSNVGNMHTSSDSTITGFTDYASE